MTNPVTRVDVDAVQVLCRELKQLHVKIGEPRFVDLEQLSLELKAAGTGVQFLSKSNINDTVRGNRTTLPRWEWVSSFATVCRVYAQRNGAPNADQLGDSDYWRDRWYKAKRATIPTGPWAIADAVDAAGPKDEASAAATTAPTGRPGCGTSADKPRPAGLAEDLTADRYRKIFGKHAGQHAVDLLKAADAADGRDPEACCRLGLLLTSVGCTDEGGFWLSVAARDADDPFAVALLEIPPDRPPGRLPNRAQFAAECLYDMAVGEGYQRMRTRDTRPADWIELYLKVAARCGHTDAAYHLAIRLRARGHDDQAAYWFSVAARKGHPAAPDRFETIYKEIRQSLDDEWDPRSGD